MIRFPEPRVSFDRITDLVYLGSRIASLDDYHRLKAQGVRACVDPNARQIAAAVEAAKGFRG